MATPKAELVSAATGEITEYDSRFAVLQMVRDADDVAGEMVDKVFNAPSFADALVLTEATGLRDLAGEVITIHGATLRESTIRDSLGVYVVMDATYGTPPIRGAITCGAAKVIAQCCRAQVDKAWPVTVRVHERTNKSDPSRSSLHLVAADRF